MPEKDLRPKIQTFTGGEKYLVQTIYDQVF